MEKKNLALSELLIDAMEKLLINSTSTSIILPFFIFIFSFQFSFVLFWHKPTLPTALFFDFSCPKKKMKVEKDTYGVFNRYML